MAIAHVQTPTPVELSNVTSIGKTFTSTPVVGNYIFVFVGAWTSAGTAPTITSVTDNKGNSYSLARQQSVINIAGSRANVWIYYAKVATATATFTVTVNFSASVLPTLGISEFSGVKATSPLDASNNGGTGSSTSASSGSITPTGTCLYLGQVGHAGSGTTTPSTSGSWAQLVEIDENNDSQVQNIAYVIGSGAKSETWTIPNSAWGAQAVAFQEESAGGPTTHFGEATISGNGSLAASGKRITFTTASMSGAGSLGGVGRKVTFGSTSFTGVGSLESIGLRTVFGSSSISGAGSLEATGQRTAVVSAALSGESDLAAVPLRIAVGSASLSGVGSLAAQIGTAVTHFGAASLSGLADMVAVAKRIAVSGSSFTGAGGLSATGKRIAVVSAALSGVGSLTARVQGAAKRTKGAWISLRIGLGF